jgi:hypothetical protein
LNSGTPKQALEWLGKAMLQKGAIPSTAPRPNPGVRSIFGHRNSVPSPENLRNNSSVGNKTFFNGRKSSFGSGWENSRGSPDKEDPAAQQPIVQFSNKMRNPFAGNSPDIGKEETPQPKSKFLGNHGPLSHFDCISEHDEENIDVSFSRDLRNSQFVTRKIESESKRSESESKKSETESSHNSERSEEIFRKLANRKKKKDIVVEGSSDEGVQYVVDENFFEDNDQTSEAPGPQLSNSSGSDVYDSEQVFGKKKTFKTDFDFDKRYGYFYENKMKTGHQTQNIHLSKVTHGTMISCNQSRMEPSIRTINNSINVMPSNVSSDRMSKYPFKADSTDSDDLKKKDVKKTTSSGYKPRSRALHGVR